METNNSRPYKDYFNIDPKYYAAVTEELIKSGKVKWTAFYPHETFVNLLEKTHWMLSGKDSRSLWIEGAYGTGKSHAALTVKSLLEANDNEIYSYFEEYGLRKDLADKLVTDKNNGKLITIHRIGSASIRSDQDLILAVQDSIIRAMEEHGIKNRGDSSLKDAALRWLENKEANRIYFNSLIGEDRNRITFNDKNVDEIISILKDPDDPDTAVKMMRRILKVAEENGITALKMDINSMGEWIKNIIKENQLSGILFVWDEFTEFFQNNQNGLTGFQTLTEISESSPFYFLIVTHESGSLIQDKDMRKKILNRFVGDKPVRIELPENMAFKLMAQAMKTTNDPNLLSVWESYKAELNENLGKVRDTIQKNAQLNTASKVNTMLSDDDMKAIVPIHPYAALILKHMSVAFNSNARSMFDFIISNDTTEAKGFKWFINNHGPVDIENLLTLDMLWDFFTAKDHSGLNDDVRVILDSYNLIDKDSLTQEQQAIFKALLLLEAISLRVSDVKLLRPSEKNIDLAFDGTELGNGRSKHIARELVDKGILFERPVGNGLKEYTVANRDGNIGQIKKIKDEIRSNLSVKELIENSRIKQAVKLSPDLTDRFIIEYTDNSHFKNNINKLSSIEKPNRFKTIITFSINDGEIQKNNKEILDAVRTSESDLIYIESLTPMGEDLLNQYVENLAYSRNYEKSDKRRAKDFERQAVSQIETWTERLLNGPFKIYTSEFKDGRRYSNFEDVQEELKDINKNKYFNGLSQYTFNDTMYQKTTFALGAQCGIEQTFKSLFKSSNINTSIAQVVDSVLNVDDYWIDPRNEMLPISRIKQKAEQVIKDGFEGPGGRVNILDIIQSLEEAPIGLLPNNAYAFVLGFVLKEYVTPDYFWSNGSVSDHMTPEKMKGMIANALKKIANPTLKYKDEFIVAMSPNQRSFLQTSAKVFNIPAEYCGSIESTRDRIRSRMRNLTYPIWCLKGILPELSLKTSPEILEEVIDSFIGIANPANGPLAPESQLADKIGGIALKNPDLQTDLINIFNDDMCQNGMIDYISKYNNGKLISLSKKIDDNGRYLDRIKQKFNADDANWVWSQETANGIIDDTILEYEIIDESNSILGKFIDINQIIKEWIHRVDQIKIPYEILNDKKKDIIPFLSNLKKIVQNGKLYEQDYENFYNSLNLYKDKFDDFYRDQFPIFHSDAEPFLTGLNLNERKEIFNRLNSGQFFATRSDYYRLINKLVDEYKLQLSNNKLKELWRSNTGTLNPAEWSQQYKTPILCMFSSNDRNHTKKMLDIVNEPNPSQADAEEALKFLSKAKFYSDLKDSDSRDRNFMNQIVGDYSILLNDPNAIRDELIKSLNVRVYDWTDNAAIHSHLKTMASREYKLKGYEQVKNKIEKMDEEELRLYLNSLIAENLTVGIQILKTN